RIDPPGAARDIAFNLLEVTALGFNDFLLYLFFCSRFTRQRLQRRLVKAVVDELLGLEIRSFFQENNFNLRPLHHSLWIESRNKSITHEIVKRSGNLPLIEPAVAHDDIDAPLRGWRGSSKVT